MSIEINGQVPSALTNTKEETRVQVGRSETNIAKQATGNPSTLDTVTVTETAAQLRQLENALAKLPVVDLNRVEGIRNVLHGGAYEINLHRVADKMMNFERALAGRSSNLYEAS